MEGTARVLLVSSGREKVHPGKQGIDPWHLEALYQVHSLPYTIFNAPSPQSCCYQHRLHHTYFKGQRDITTEISVGDGAQMWYLVGICGEHLFLEALVTSLLSGIRYSDLKHHNYLALLVLEALIKKSYLATSPFIGRQLM